MKLKTAECEICRVVLRTEEMAAFCERLRKASTAILKVRQGLRTSSMRAERESLLLADCDIQHVLSPLKSLARRREVDCPRAGNR